MFSGSPHHSFAPLFFKPSRSPQIFKLSKNNKNSQTFLLAFQLKNLNEYGLLMIQKVQSARDFATPSLSGCLVKDITFLLLRNVQISLYFQYPLQNFTLWNSSACVKLEIYSRTLRYTPQCLVRFPIYT